MMNLFQRFAIFMQGRYGYDTLNKFLSGLVFAIYIINFFVFNRLAHFIIFLINMLIIALIIFRMLSRNITMRSAENRKFLKIYGYRKCPSCKATLRVKNKKGVHTVRCPKCRFEFKTKI